jgi:hypothetical protein
MICLKWCANSKRFRPDALTPCGTSPDDPSGYAERCAKSDFPGETFRVLKEKELCQFGEYRTRRLVLEAWEKWVTTASKLPER